MAKPRADSVLKTLPEDLQADLFQRMRHGELSIEQAVTWLEEQHDTETSRTAVSNFYQWYSYQERMHRLHTTTGQLEKLIQEKAPTMTPEAVRKIGQQLFLAQALDSENTKDFVALATLQLKAQGLELDERRIKLLEEKANRADDAEGILKDVKLTEDEKAAKLRAVWGLQ